MMPRRHVLAVVVVVLAAALGAACDDEQGLVFTGRLLLPDGSPARMGIDLIRDEQVCPVVEPVDPDPGPYALPSRAHTEADGRFRVERSRTDYDAVPLADQQAWEIVAVPDAGRVRASIEVGANRPGDYDVGDIVVPEDLALEASEQAGAVRLSWAAAPGSYEVLVLAPTTCGWPAWTARSTQPEAVLDPRSYADFGVAFVVEANVTPPPGEGPPITVRSMQLPNVFDPALPDSRDAPCEIETTTGEHLDGAAGGAACFATDGKLAGSRADDCADCEMASVTIDLGPELRAEAIAVHGITSEPGEEGVLLLEGSEQLGQPFVAIAELPVAAADRSALVVLDVPQTIRFIRLRSSGTQSNRVSIDEISVFRAR